MIMSKGYPIQTIRNKLWGPEKIEEKKVDRPKKIYAGLEKRRVEID